MAAKKLRRIGMLLVAAIFIFSAAGCGNEKEEMINMPIANVFKSAKPLTRTTGSVSGFNAPTGIAFDKSGNMYVSNWSGGNITKVDAAGNRSVFTDIPGSPAGLAVDSQGYLYIADYSENVVYRVDGSGKKEVFCKDLHTPTGIAFNKEGNLLVANRSSNEIVKIDSAGNKSIYARGLNTPVGVVECPDGSLYVTNYGGGISKINREGAVSTISNEFATPGVGIAVSPNGEIFAVDYGAGMIKNIEPDGKSVKVIAENLKSPVALAFNQEGTLFVGTWGDGTVKAVNIE